ALGLGLGWYGVALAGWGAAFVREHLVGRYLGNLVGGFGTVDYTPAPRPLAYHLAFYPTHLLASALPWTPFTAAALWRLGRRGGFRDARARFLLCWAAAPVIAFTPAATKLRHYLLPSLPPLALLTAPTVIALLETSARHLERRSLALRAAGLLLGAAALRPFARAIAARYPAPAPIAFYGRPVRAVVVYLGRHARTLDERPGAITAGLPVVAVEEAYGRLAADHVVGAPLLSAEGRLGD